MPGRTVNNIAGSASRKRNRRAADEEDDIVDAQEASSSLRHDSRKRVRISGAGTSNRASKSARDASPDSPTEDDDVEMNAVERNDEPSATQYEIMRDNGFRHLEHADEDDRRATQRIAKRNKMREDRQRNRSDQMNQAADNGILESITCVNFMCHERLHCELGPLLNFVVGENGSGKSAILTAITLCLGGKASATNRGGSLKNFVKEGRDQSILTVKIKNQGTDAYQPDLFGESIVVERHFSKSGSSGFRLKSATNRTISTKKSEIEEIIEYYCLQVDNPLNVLSQDMARQFLNASTPNQKYKFFLQGVQLQQLDDDYRVIQDFVDANMGKEDDLEARVEVAKKHFEKAKRDFELLQKSDGLRQKCRLYTKQLVWSQVVREEQDLEKYEQDLVAVDGEIAAAEQLVHDKEQILGNVDEDVRKAEEAVTKVRRDEVEVKENLQTARQNYELEKSALSDLHRDERDARARAKNAQDSVKEYEKKMQEEEQRLEEANGDAPARKLQEMKEARAKLEKFRQEIERANQMLPELVKKQEAAQGDLNTLNKEIEQKRDEITSTERKIQDSSQGHRSLYDGYEPRVPQLLKMIEDDSGFDRKPVGPIGAHIQLLQPMWSSILEKSFGATLNGFIVANKRDQSRLGAMMKRLGISRCPIMIASATSAINTRGKEPDEQFDTILRVLKIDDPLVRNQLIINHRIEQIILIEKRADAERVMFDDNGAPRNANACFHIHAGKRGHGVALKANQHGYGSDPIKPNHNQKPRLKAESGREIPFLQESLVQLTSELRELEAKKRRLDQTIQRCRLDLTEQKKLVNDRKRKENNVAAEMNNIQEVIDSFDGADGRLESLREDLKAAQAELDTYGDQYANIVLAKEAHNKTVEAANNEYKAANEALKNFQAQLNMAVDKVKRMNDSRHIILVEKNDASENKDLKKERKESLGRKRKRQAERVEDFTSRAAAQCERVHVPEDETYDSIQKKLKTVQDSLERRQKSIGMTDEQVIAKAHQTKDALAAIEDASKQTQSENKLMRDTLEQRIKKWRCFQRWISSNTRANFMYLLAEREFRGGLKLDHYNHLLEVSVEPDKTLKDQSKRSTKSLSGGEKSFSSICLLLAIWEAMGSPLRCLDEFDVFMDNVNRKVSTQMLIDAARNSVGRQYILITPNAIEGRAKLDKDVKIIRLVDPRQTLIADH